MKFRKGINFTKNIEKYEKKEKIFYYLRLGTIFLTLLALSAIFYTLYTNLRLTVEEKKKIEEKNQLIESLVKETTKSRKLAIIAQKINAAKKRLEEDDINFKAYFNLIANFINYDPDQLDKLSTEEATLAAGINIQQFSLKNDQKTSWAFLTNNQQDYRKLLDLIEDDSFLSVFNELTLKSLVLERSSQEADLNLEIQGEFKKRDVEF